MSREASRPETNEGLGGFGSTEWSLVLAAGKDEGGSRALDNLCRKYWRPMYVHIRRSGIPPADAEDVTQAFFVYLIDKGWIGQADPSRGSFRAFLRTLLKNFLANHQRTTRAAKRTGVQISINTEEGERALEDVAERGKDAVSAFDHSWARSVLQAAWERLGAEQAAAGKADLFESMRPYVTQPASAGEYEKLGKLMGLRSGQVALAVHRLSRRYADLIRAEVAETLADRKDLETELRNLLLLTSR